MTTREGCAPQRLAARGRKADGLSDVELRSTLRSDDRRGSRRAHRVPPDAAAGAQAGAGARALVYAVSLESRRRRARTASLVGAAPGGPAVSMRVIQTERDAVAFMRSAKLALRYGSSAALPLSSIYSTAIDKRRAIELTNALLARADVVETNVIAGRLVLVWRELVPALYALRVRFRGRLSADATRALELIRK